QYAIQGYGVAFRYLCKPITFPMFRQTIIDATSYLLPQKITLSYNGTQKMVSVNDILYFESLAHHIIFHLISSKNFEVKDSMEHMIQTLQHPNFVRVHRSFCVNLDYIDNIKLPQITMTDGTEIPISRNKQDELLCRFTNKIRGS
ncbi:MAG: LytTR family transcriptional regulator DNA-binding domain-containing protein, partial [Lachnospiraceae bacterium]|nr:LytTR family transcriptional regulator DNA-binding domain-containing protein [Lachnospiraceae bacterium]